jgi:stage II sporulation SpoAA-like protein
MLATISGLPDNVVAFAAKGRVTRRDYDEVLTPAVDEALKRHPKVRCYYELGSQFTGMDAGAAWEDFKLGIGHLTRWEKVAVVTDVDWIRHTMNAFRFLMPGEIKVFPTTEAAEARAWISAG